MPQARRLLHQIVPTSFTIAQLFEALAMKSSDRHRSAFESMSKTLGAVADCLTKSKTLLKRYLKWLIRVSKLLARMKKIAGDMSPPKDQAQIVHPQIWFIQMAVFDKLRDSCDSLNAFCDTVFVKKAQEAFEEHGKKCDELANSLKRFLVVFASHYEKLQSQVKRTGEPAGTYVALETAFEHHCCYLRYFRDLKSLEELVEQKLKESTDVITVIMAHIDDSMAKVDHLLLHRFGHKIAGESTAKLTEDLTPTVTSAAWLSQKTISAFREPAFDRTLVCEFKNEEMKMSVKEAYTGKEDGELTVEAGETVELLDSSTVSFWKVAKANGQRGYVPALILVPQVTLGTERARRAT